MGLILAAKATRSASSLVPATTPPGLSISRRMDLTERSSRALSNASRTASCPAETDRPDHHEKTALRVMAPLTGI